MYSGSSEEEDTISCWQVEYARFLLVNRIPMRRDSRMVGRIFKCEKARLTKRYHIRDISGACQSKNFDYRI